MNKLTVEDQQMIGTILKLIEETVGAFVEITIKAPSGNIRITPTGAFCDDALVNDDYSINLK